MKIRVQIINEDIPVTLPVYSTEHASGMDLASASAEPIIIMPMETKPVPTNLKFEIPVGYEGQIRPRSGLAIKYNIGIMNSPGTIDADYRGELKVLLTNFGKEPFSVNNGDRIAQLVICKVEKAELEIETELSKTKRDSGGFGHTGIK